MGIVTGASSRYCCITVEQMLEDLVASNNPQSINLDKNGMLMALMSDVNNTGFEMIATDDLRGKGLPSTGNRKVFVKYYTRNCEAAVDTPSGLCDTVSDDADDAKYATMDVTCFKQVSLQLDKEEFRQLCEGPNERLARRFAEKVADLKRAVNDDLITKFIAGLGNYFTSPGGTPVNSATNPRTLKLFNAQAQPNAMGMWPVQNDYLRSGFTGAPIVIGGPSFDALGWARPIFAGDNDGKDANRAPGRFSMFTDYKLDSIFATGNEHAISFAPGTVKMAEWYQFPQGTIYEELKEDYNQTTMTVDGFKFDIQWKYDECTGKTTWHLQKYYDLFKIPDDAYSAACDQDSNGCLNWLVDCAALDCTDLKPAS